MTPKPFPSSKSHKIFPPWQFPLWTAIDDRVRGGSSLSHLDPIDLLSPSLKNEKPAKIRAARFWGSLDIDTLGGAGFASQRFLFGPLPLHLPEIQYRGLCLVIHPDPHLPNSNSNSNSDSNSESNNNNNNNNVMAKHPKEFTVVLKTTLNTVPPNHPKTPPTPEPASLSYEADFTPQHKSKHDADVPSYGEEICIGWSSFTPMYRGKEVGSDDPIYKPLSSESVYEMSLMCRSGFGDQKGEFGLVVGFIGGWKREDEERWWGWFQGIAGWVRAWLGLGGEGSVRLDEKRSTV